MRRRSLLLIALACSVLAGSLAVLLRNESAPQPHPLAHPIDPSFLTDLTFGKRSYWLQPWRAYLDTVPASRMLEAVGINFNVTAAEAPATARLLADNGFRRARIEIGWGEFSYDHPTQLIDAAQKLTILRSLKAAGLRPLILLNGNAGLPCPGRGLAVTITDAVPAGAQLLHLSATTARAVVPGRSGLNSFTQYKAPDVLFTSVTKEGWAALSKPLPRALAAGTYPGTTLLYGPFSSPKLSNGQPNPASQSTLNGWLSYVGAVTRFAKLALGSDRFDVEVWNEVVFASDFLGINDYFEPAIDHGVGDVTQPILQSTVAMIRDPANGLPDVGIGNGFSNQTPFPAGSFSPPGLTALDKHPYPPDLSFPPGTANHSVPLNAFGAVDGSRDVQGNWHDAFTPHFRAFFPEYILSAIQTETLVRDLSPITNAIYGYAHGRFTHPPGAAAPAVWLTEDNLPALNRLPQIEPVVARHIMTKAVLRILTSFVNKGTSAVYFYAAKDGGGLNLIDPTFFAAADAGRQAGRQLAGETIAAVHRLVSTFTSSQNLSRTRAISLLGVADFGNQFQFSGDGTRAHPPLYNRDVLAVLPYQVTDNRFVVPVYVMTRDMGHLYANGASGPARYDLRPERFRLSLGGLDARLARVTATDPLTGASVPVEIHARTGGVLAVEMPVTDSPRLLVIDDAPA